MDKDKISEKFDNWPDRIISLSYVPLVAEKASVLTLSSASLLIPRPISSGDIAISIASVRP